LFFYDGLPTGTSSLKAYFNKVVLRLRAYLFNAYSDIKD